MPKLESACPLDCPDNCSLEVEVVDGRIEAIGGTHKNPDTAGFICSKVRHFDRRVYHETRLRTPLIREPGSTKGDASFREATWDEALTLVAERLRDAVERTGGASILPYHYGGSNGVLTEGAVDALLFSRLGATDILPTLCAAPTSAAASGLYGKMLGVAFEDFARADVIVVWGANPHASNIHLAPHLKRASSKGSKVLVVDPRATKAARAADLHLALRPGTDVVLALAMSNWLFENGRADLAFLDEHATGVDEFRRRASAWSIERASEVCGVPAEDIVEFVRTYADAETALVRCGWGLERNRNGGSAVAAVLALPAVAGKFGKPGGGYTMSNSRAFLFRPRADFEASWSRTVDMKELGRLLTDELEPAIDVFFVYNANPLTTVPDQERIRRGLERDDLFTVVYEQVMTDTAYYADVLLPATTFFEHFELSSGYGALSMQVADRVIEPVGGARPNYEVFGELARRLGVWKDTDTDAPFEMVERALTPDLIRAINENGIALRDRPIQFVDEWPNTNDRKVHLVPDDLEREAPFGLYHFQPDPATDAHPLALISPATERTISSSLGELYRDTAALLIHPDDARDRGIVDGASVRVFNALGEVRTVARVTDDVRPGVVLQPKGIWAHNTTNGRTSNALCPDTSADLGKGACFNDARVQVEAV